jgi:hypothetical protein
MMSPGGKLSVLALHPTKKPNKAVELTYLSTNIGIMHSSLVGQPVRDDEKGFKTLRTGPNVLKLSLSVIYELL